MNSVIILLHILTAILFLGPITVAVSTFHVQALKAHEGDPDARGSAKMLHRVTSTYGMLSLIVPLLGFAIMFTGDYWRDGRFHASILLSLLRGGYCCSLSSPSKKLWQEPLDCSMKMKMKTISTFQIGGKRKLSYLCWAASSPPSG